MIPPFIGESAIKGHFMCPILLKHGSGKVNVFIVLVDLFGLTTTGLM